MCHVNMLKGYHVRDDTKPVFNHNFIINCDGCDIRLENADIPSNLGSKVLHLEPGQQFVYLASNHVFIGGGCNVDNPCLEGTIDID